MLHTLKKGNITLSNWIQDSQKNWIKHRLYDYSVPFDSIKIVKEYKNLELVWEVYFNGKNIEYIEYIYRILYKHQTFCADQIETVKNNINLVLNKADKLIILA